MADCGANEFMRGGVLADAQIVSSTITDTRVSSSVLDGDHIQNLASLDAASAKVIASAIASLSPAALSELADAIAKQLAESVFSAGSTPGSTMETTLPLTVTGSRDGLLGRPVAWLKYQGYVLPGYQEKG